MKPRRRHMKPQGTKLGGGPVGDGPSSPPPKPTATPSPFGGVGAFTAHDPLCLVRDGIADCFDWVALKGDGGDHATIGVAEQLLQSGVKRLHVWRSFDGQVMYARSEGGFIGQAEGAEQLAQAEVIGATFTERALVTNNFMAAIPAGWVSLAESYWNVVEASSPGSVVSDSLNRGAKTAYPVFGVGTWGEAYRTVPLEDYVKAWGPTNWSVYLGELLRPEDIAYLKSLRSLAGVSP